MDYNKVGFDIDGEPLCAYLHEYGHEQLLGYRLDDNEKHKKPNDEHPKNLCQKQKLDHSLWLIRVQPMASNHRTHG